jgi:hypothetical protein
VQSAIRDQAYSSLSGSQWLGLRVRASACRVSSLSEIHRSDSYCYSSSASSSSSSSAAATSYSIGTIRQHRPSSGMHLVVFDDPQLQAQWVKCQKSSIELILDTDSASTCASGEFALAQSTKAATDVKSESTSTSSSSSSTAMTVAVAGDAMAGNWLQHLDTHSECDYSKSRSCALCLNQLMMGTFKRCSECGLKCHTSCIPPSELSDGGAGSSAEGGASQSQQWGTSTGLPWTCWNCSGKELRQIFLGLIFFLIL